MNNIVRSLTESLNRLLVEETEEEKTKVKEKLDALDLEVRRIREAETGQPGRTKIFSKFKRQSDGKYLARLRNLTVDQLNDYMDWIEEASKRTGIKVDFQDNINVRDTYSWNYSNDDKIRYNLTIIIYADEN